MLGGAGAARNPLIKKQLWVGSREPKLKIYLLLGYLGDVDGYKTILKIKILIIILKLLYIKIYSRNFYKIIKLKLLITSVVKKF